MGGCRTPLEAVVLSETVEEWLAGLDEEERPILELSLQGYTTREISERLGRAERTVRLLREGVRHRLQRMQRGGPQPAGRVALGPVPPARRGRAVSATRVPMLV